MKRIFFVLLALALLLTLAACGGAHNESPAESTPVSSLESNPVSTPASSEAPAGSTSVDPENVDYSAIFSGNGANDFIWAVEDSATRQALIDAAKQDGYDVSFGVDGTTTITNEAGVKYTQNPDGTWKYADEEGNEGQIGGNWPDNEYSELLPKPDFKIKGVSVENNTFAVGFDGATYEQIKNYVAEVKAKGFTVGAEETDQSVDGYTVYVYTASNGNGYSVTVSFTSDISAVSVKKE